MGFVPYDIKGPQRLTFSSLMRERERGGGREGGIFKFRKIISMMSAWTS